MSRANQLRSLTIDDQVLEVPTGIYRDGLGWRIDIDRRRVGGRRERHYVPDRTRPPARSLQEAMARLAANPLARVQDGRSSPAPRARHRRLRLSRETRGNAVRFQLEIQPSKSAWRRPWMRVYLGTDRTLTQERITDAIQRLTARWQAFRRIAEATSVAHALEQCYDHVAPVQRPHAKLRLSNVRAWNGHAVGVSFSPAADVDPARHLAWAPEISGRAPFQRQARRAQGPAPSRRPPPSDSLAPRAASVTAIRSTPS